MSQAHKEKKRKITSNQICEDMEQLDPQASFIILQER